MKYLSVPCFSRSVNKICTLPKCKILAFLMIHFQSVASCKASWHRYEIITWYIKSCFLLLQGPFVRKKKLQRMNNVPHIYLLHVDHKMCTIFWPKERPIKNIRTISSLWINLFFCILFVSMKKYQQYDQYF